MRFNRELYSKTALLKAAYFYTDRMYVHLDADADYYYVRLIPREGQDAVSEEEFSNEMLAQSVRHEIYLQTKNIRELLLARAMSTSLVTCEGLVTEDLKLEDHFSEDQILKDWFDNNDETA